MTDAAATQKALSQTAADEGYRAKPYKDTRQLWTLGEGRCLETHPLSGSEWKLLLDRGFLDITLTRAGADLLEGLELGALTARLAHDYYDFWPRLNDARKAALLEMAYQMGVDAEESFHDMMLAIRVAVASGQPGDWARVEQAGLDSLWAKQTPERAERVMAQLRSGEVGNA